jgi:hypothetical protein
LSSASVDFTIDVSDQEFGTVQGDTVTAKLQLQEPGSSTWTDSGTNSTTSNGTVTVSASPGVGGEWQYRWVLTDSHGASTTTSSRTVNVPAELRIYRETNPPQLVNDSVQLRVRFYGLSSDQVITRYASDGTVDLAGLPVDERFVVTVSDNQTDRWTYRRIVIDSIYEQSEVYLLNESQPHSQILFQLDDPTGQFPPDETLLYIERPLTYDFDGDGTNETQYRVIAGDTFGSTAQFPVILQTDERYRIRVETVDGSSSRILGAYSVYGDATEPLQIKRVEPSGDSAPGAAVYGGISESSGTEYVAVRYIDDNESTTQVKYRILYQNGTVWIANTTRTADTFADLYPIPANTSTTASYKVEWWITRGGQTTSGTFQVGKIGSIAGRFNMDPQVLSIASWLAILSTMGLLVIVDHKLAPIGGSGMATALTMIGTVAIPLPLLGVAGAVSVLVLFGGQR